MQISANALVFYLPAEVAEILGKPIGLEVGFVSTVPWICALAAAFWLPRLADRYSNHCHLAVLTFFVSGLASGVSVTARPAVSLIALSIAASGFIAVQPLFWTFPTRYLAGRAAAGGIAMINALGALGGFVATNLKAWADRHFQSLGAGFHFIAALSVLGALLIAFIDVRTLSLGAEATQD
jgi:hypothetical protein